MKVGIIDSGIDPAHPFFDPAGYVMPAGFPKGQQRFTTAKVIVARVFAPKSATAASARVAYSDDDSSHGTHVAGIAAGNADTNADGRRISGVAPRAYLGNYKVFVETSTGLSPNANSPAIVAAIEAAVADGMNVINFSGGEPEIEPSRDIVAIALDAAAAAGVVPVVAAGNDYNDLGAGSVSSPANSARAIAVGAVAIGGSPTTRTHAEFSSVGPTTISHRLKPDVAAPGVDVLSSISGGGWAEFSGTSMAAPHVAGAAALLRQRHPAWSVDQLKSALVQSGTDSTQSRTRAAGPRFQGGGVVALARADRPLVFAQPTALSFGLLARGQTGTGTILLGDAGGGAGTWEVARIVRGHSCGDSLHRSRDDGRPGPAAGRRDRASRRPSGRPRCVRRASAWRGRPPDPDLGPRHACVARASYRRTAGSARRLPQHDGRPPLGRVALPLPRDASRYRRDDDARRTGARVPVPDREARRERRRRDHAARAREARSSRASSPGGTRTG